MSAARGSGVASQAGDTLVAVLEAGFAFAQLSAEISMPAPGRLLVYVGNCNFMINWCGDTHAMWVLTGDNGNVVDLPSTSAVLRELRARLDPDFRPSAPIISTSPGQPD